jgi:hypothetical protein
MTFTLIENGAAEKMLKYLDLLLQRQLSLLTAVILNEVRDPFLLIV